ncbi:MAG: hypothetical protein RBR39_09585 [Proteiniphilum sp.]|nr:hypothetical protein [Proteiniphilum sp.]
MAYKNRSYVVDQNLILSSAQALPNATAADSTNVVDYGGNSGGLAKIVVKANTDIAVASTYALTIVASYGSTSTPTDTLDKVLFTKTAAAAGFSYAAGDTIVEEIIPDSLPDNYRFLKLTYTTTANESAEKVDAYVVMT